MQPQTPENQLEVLHLRLRKIRESKGWSLAQAANATHGEITAMALGSYERGDRSIAAHKLITLAKIYSVPVSELFSSNKEQPTNKTVTLDIRRLATSEKAHLRKVLPILHSIAHKRGDWNGEIISLRSTDVGNLAIFAGIEKHEIEELISTFSISRSK